MKLLTVNIYKGIKNIDKKIELFSQPMKDVHLKVLAEPAPVQLACIFLSIYLTGESRSLMFPSYHQSFPS